MSLGTSNRDGGRTSESGHLRPLLKAFKAQVLTGLQVSQRGAGANMSVDIAIGDAIIPRSDGTYGHPAWNDATYNQVIATADVSNPRRDIIVMYIDYGQTPSTGVSNNTNGVVKIKSVAGTPAGSPVDPTDVAIQSSVGAGNPFIKLARVRVAAGTSSITNSVIDDLRIMATGIMQGGWIYDDTYTWVYASASTFTIAGIDATAQFPSGTKIAIHQSGAIKYFVVISAAFSTNTTVTLASAGNVASPYSLTNVPIDIPAFSYMARPSGFPGVIREIMVNVFADNTGGATPSITLGQSAVAFTGTPTGFARMNTIVPQDYVAGTDVVLRIRTYASNTATHTARRYVNADAVGDSLSTPWDVDSNVQTTGLSYTANTLKEIDVTIAAAHITAGCLISMAWRIETAITGTVWVEGIGLRYTANS